MFQWIREKFIRDKGSVYSERAAEGTTTSIHYSNAYEKVDVVKRCVELIISGCVDVKFQTNNVRLDASLNSRPNVYENNIRFFRRCYLEYILEGNCFIYDDGANLYVLNSKNMEIVRDSKRFVSHYVYRPNKTEEFLNEDNGSIRFEVKEIIHVRGDSSNSYVRGESRLKSVEDTINLYYELTRFQRDFFKNGTIPGLILRTENVLSPTVKKRILRDWEAGYSTWSKNARKPALLDGGLDISPLTNQTFTELDYSRSVEIVRDNIAESLGVPPLLLHSGNNANVSPNLRLFYFTTVLPIVRSFAAAFGHHYKANVEADILSVKALRGDKAEEANYLSTLVNGGIMTPNEAREHLKVKPIAGFDTIRVPANVAGSALDAGKGGRPSED